MRGAFKELGVGGPRLGVLRLRELALRVQDNVGVTVTVVPHWRCKSVRWLVNHSCGVLTLCHLFTLNRAAQTLFALAAGGSTGSARARQVHRDVLVRTGGAYVGALELSIALPQRFLLVAGRGARLARGGHRRRFGLVDVASRHF